MLTVCTNCAEVLLRNLSPPVYFAVSVCFPTVSVEILGLAVPFVKVPSQILVEPCSSTTEPCGVVPGYSGVTEIVKITACPEVDGFTEELSVVVVVALFTTSLKLPELGAKFASPAYLATIGSVPGTDFENVMLALPPLSVPVPRMSAPQLNVTCSPLGGGPIAELTVAVTVTGWFTTAGFTCDVTEVSVFAITT